MTPMTEDRIRTAYAWIAAHQRGDNEAVRVLTTNTDLEELAGDLAEIAAMLIRNLGTDPKVYLDATFDAIARSYRTDPS